jgi:hypothetical protein
MALIVFASAWRVSLLDGTSRHYKKPMIFSPLIVGTKAPQNWNRQVIRLNRFDWTDVLGQNQQRVSKI